MQIIALEDPIDILLVRGRNRRPKMLCHDVMTSHSWWHAITGKTIVHSTFSIQRLQTFSKNIVINAFINVYYYFLNVYYKFGNNYSDGHSWYARWMKFAGKSSSYYFFPPNVETGRFVWVYQQAGGDYDRYWTASITWHLGRPRPRSAERIYKRRHSLLRFVECRAVNRFYSFSKFVS